MADKFKTDTFHVKRAMHEFLEKETEARIKEYDSCVKIGGLKVRATVEFKDGFVLVDVGTPVEFI